METSPLFRHLVAEKQAEAVMISDVEARMGVAPIYAVLQTAA